MLFRDPYNSGERMQSSLDSALRCEDESLTVQSQKEEADINTLVRRFGITGTMPQNVEAPTYASFGAVFDFRSAMDAILSARESFESLPADVRLRFANDPQRFVEFCSDAGNLAELRKLGLAIPEEVKEDSAAVSAAVGESK
ncbi:MAG: internal scaffolding protein [Microviridae sp.]|nr:MAG: internal scaffolding protein [Microviridae sp.]